MQDSLYEEICNVLNSSIATKEVIKTYKKRLKQGFLTRDQNSKSHFCAYFLPVDRKNERIFLTHHKKAKRWISPGGHIDSGESIVDTIVREFYEELGVKISKDQINKLFLHIREA